MPFATFAEFKHFLDGACVALTGRCASTHKSMRNAPRIEAADLAWWSSTGRRDGLSAASKNRNRAYLISYFALVENNLPAEGVRLHDGSFVWPDRSVISATVILTFDQREGTFALTKAGRLFAGQSGSTI